MKITALIPARYGSSRFPGKPLAKLGGITVIERVCRRVAEAGITPAVATDDERIYREVERAGFTAVMTSGAHRSGTDRIREALDKLPEASLSDVVINVQGDEPFIRPDQLRALAEVFEDPQVEIATLVKKFDPAKGFEALFDPNLVKVVLSEEGFALYFSRSIIPYVRNYPHTEWLDKAEFHTHLGVYAYRPATLRAITELAQAPLEIAESLEQLRWLSHGYRIRAVETAGESVGIDTPADLEAAEKYLQSAEGE